MARIFLAMNGQRINTLDELRTYFNADQMLSFYKVGRLQKWLEELGAAEELENINSFEPGYDDDTLLSMLMAAFELSAEQIQAVNDSWKQELRQKEEAEKAATESAAVTEPEELNSVLSPIEPACVSGVPHITWSFCGLPSWGDKPEATSETVKFSDISEKGKLPSIGQMKFDEMCFAEGYFWGFCKVANKFDCVLKSADAIHWTVMKETDTSKREDIKFILYQDGDISLVVIQEILLNKKYVRTGNGNWKLLFPEQHEEYSSLSDQILLCDDKLFINTEPAYCQETTPWTKSRFPKLEVEKRFYISKVRDHFILVQNRADFLFSSLLSVGTASASDHFLFYSRDGKEWTPYSEIHGKVWEKVLKAVRCLDFAIGNNKIVIFSSQSKSYVVGEID